jgi:hypothetical protein
MSKQSGVSSNTVWVCLLLVWLVGCQTTSNDHLTTLNSAVSQQDKGGVLTLNEKGEWEFSETLFFQ